MRECRSLPSSRVLESDGLDPATEKCVPLFQPIERGVQLCHNCLGLISHNDQFDIDLFVEHLNTSASNLMPARRQSTPHTIPESAQPTGKSNTGVQMRGSAMRPTASGVLVEQDSAREQILSAQLRLLYANTNLGVGVNILAATVLGALQWGIVSQAGRHRLVALHDPGVGRAIRIRPPVACFSQAPTDVGKWRTAFTVGVGLTGAGWGAAGILLYPTAHLTNQVFLVFVLGGMMLGASLLLAPRPEAFLAFLLPAGLGPAVRLFLEGDETHLRWGYWPLCSLLPS
jgi:hypothetical protein